MDKNKRNKIVGLSIGILVVLIIVVSSTYAYWQITRTQKTPNDIVAACLNLDLKDASAENKGINLNSAWPISDEEGKTLTGYTFTVTNNCDEEINYVVGLNRVEEENYLQDSSIKLQLDNNSTFLYSDLSDVEYVDPDNTEYTARSSKQVSVETISANGTNTHTIRVWVSSDAPVTEQSKIFLGQVFITGGQGIEIPECFTIADNGTLIGYNYECGVEVVVPREINGITVKEINPMSFKDYDVAILVGKYGEKTLVSGDYEYESEDYIYYFKNESEFNTFAQLMKPEYCEDPENCDIFSILSDEGFSVLIGLEEYNNHEWFKYDVIGLDVIRIDPTTKETSEASASLTKLDLSNTTELEKVSDYALWGRIESDTPIDDSCVLSKGVYSCNGKLSTVILPNNGKLSTLGKDAFAANKISEIVIPASVVTIENYAFYDNEIQNLKIDDTSDNPSQLTTIGVQTFDDNYLSSVVIPASVTAIGANAFSNNPSLTEIIIKRTEEDASNITFGYNWNRVGYNNETGTDIISTVTYDPNYTE